MALVVSRSLVGETARHREQTAKPIHVKLNTFYIVANDKLFRSPSALCVCVFFFFLICNAYLWWCRFADPIAHINLYVVRFARGVEFNVWTDSSSGFCFSWFSCVDDSDSCGKRACNAVHLICAMRTRIPTIPLPMFIALAHYYRASVPPVCWYFSFFSRFVPSTAFKSQCEFYCLLLNWKIIHFSVTTTADVCNFILFAIDSIAEHQARNCNIFRFIAPKKPRCIQFPMENQSTVDRLLLRILLLLAQ